MTGSVVVASDQSIEVGDGGGEVWPLAFVDEQSTDHLEPITVHGRHVDPAIEFDRIFCPGIHGESV